MKNKLYMSLITVAFLLCLIGLEGYGQAQKLSGAKTWEYHVIDAYNNSDQIERVLNQSGAQGWEYCGTNGNYYFFKRPK